MVDDKTSQQNEPQSQADEVRRAPAEVTFQAFAAGLYTQTLMALGELENPFTHKRERNEADAAFLIDTIAMLEDKTRGNLLPQEAAYVRNLLTDLRIDT